jgi:Protein of unknown function (DUF3168)
MPSALNIMPDAEEFLADWFRAQAEAIALVGARIYTTLPEDKTWPTVRLFRIGGAPADQGDMAYWADMPSIQVDVWAATKHEAWNVARTFQALAAQRLKGSYTALRVLGVQMGAARYVPDSSFTPAQPRVIFTFDTQLKPVAPIAPG